MVLLRFIFVLLFLHVGTRRVFVTPATTRSDEAWVRSQTEAFLEHELLGKFQTVELLKWNR